MNAMAVAHPWRLSFSFARALQGPALEAWRGEPHNVPAGQQAFYHRARCNSAAREGRCRAGMRGWTMRTSTNDVWLIRHGETEWSRSGRHTGRTDLPLTDAGRRAAGALAPVLGRELFALVLTSPLKRAQETCELAGLGDRVQVDPDLLEWNYGEYEGLTPAEIHERAPGWLLFTDGAPGGERPDDVGRRVDRVIARARAAPGNVVVFAHGHLLRVLAARWLGWPVAAGRHFLLDTGTVNVLSAYREGPAIKRWNAPVGR